MLRSSGVRFCYESLRRRTINGMIYIVYNCIRGIITPCPKRLLLLEKCSETLCARAREHTWTKLNFVSFRGNIRRHARDYDHTRSDILVRRFHTSTVVGEVPGFFEYSINVRKSYITNRKYTRCRGPGRASHATDYFYLRPFVLPDGKRAREVFSLACPLPALGPPFSISSYRITVLLLSRFVSTYTFSVESTDW